MEPRKVSEFLFTKFYSSKDFTILLRNDDLTHPGETAEWWEDHCHTQVGQTRDAAKPITSFEFQQEICGPGENSSDIARLQVSRAFAGNAWSITARWEPTTNANKGLKKARGDAKRAANLLEASKDWRPDTTYGFEKADPLASDRSSRRYPFVFCIRDLVDCLYDRIAEAAEPHQGLILVTGATNSAKSKIARGLVWRMLKKKIEDPRAQDRRPHLVTFEDPIEQFFWKAEHPATGDPNTAPAIDYTPRQRRKDCAELKRGLDDALRQTPSVFYIGEIRDSDEMCQAVEFGGTGHLAIATAHAGNLIEGVGKLLKAVNAANSGARAIYAPKILAVIHLKMLTFRVFRAGEKEPEEIDALTPAMYRRTPRGLQSLVADGLASVMPYFPEDGPVAQFGSLGRQYFAHALCSGSLNPEGRADAADPAIADLWNVFRRFHSGESDELPLPFDRDKAQRLIDAALEEDLYGR